MFYQAKVGTRLAEVADEGLGKKLWLLASGDKLRSELNGIRIRTRLLTNFVLPSFPILCYLQSHQRAPPCSDFLPLKSASTLPFPFPHQRNALHYLEKLSSLRHLHLVFRPARASLTSARAMSSSIAVASNGASTPPGLAGGSQPSHVGSKEMLVERALTRLRLVFALDLSCHES